jgi:hypothetical protein
MVHAKKFWMLVLFLLIPLLICAQSRPNRPGQGVQMKDQQARMFNPAIIDSVAGVIEEIRKVEGRQGSNLGYHLTVKVKEEVLDVHLGPVWYVEQEEFTFEKGDMIKLVGSRVTIDEKPSMIAKKVEVKGKELKLRGDSGRPVWAGWRKAGR